MQRLGEVPHAVPGVCYGMVSPVRESSDLLQYFAVVEVHQGAEPPPEHLEVASDMAHSSGADLKIYDSRHYAAPISHE